MNRGWEDRTLRIGYEMRDRRRVRAWRCGARTRNGKLGDRPGCLAPRRGEPGRACGGGRVGLGDAGAATVGEDLVAAALDTSVPTSAAAPEPPDDTDESETGSQPAAAPPSPPESTPNPVDTNAVSADTTGDTPARPRDRRPRAEEPVRARRLPTVAVQVSPSNVNVSVRIASPGDNGPVTQVNVTVAVASPAPAVASPASSSEATGRSGSWCGHAGDGRYHRREHRRQLRRKRRRVPGRGTGTASLIPSFSGMYAWRY